MKGTRRSAWTAMTVFALTACVVLGGMTWATVTQLRLAESEALEKHRAKVRNALWQMEWPIIGVLGSEAARPYTHYVALHKEEPEAAWTEDGDRVEVSAVALPSPLAVAGPPYPWIDLYFSVDEDGHWSSPQLSDEAIHTHHIASSLAWVRDVLPVAELPDRMASARALDRRLCNARDETRGQTVQVLRRLARGKPRAPREPGGYTSRTASRIAAQMSALPSSQCVAIDLLYGHDPYHLDDRDANLYTCCPPTFVGVSRDPITTFWLEPKPGEGRKLAFVRAAHADAKAVYQGFVADWAGLKPMMLNLALDRFPDADLVPVMPDELPPLVAAETVMSAIPARLVGPSVEHAGVAEARWSIVGALATAWAIALAVLAVAGFAVRNLVALTNRRLQFAYAVTHELRTPLTTFRLYTDMLAGGLVPEESRQEYLDTLNRESRRLSNLVQGVLEYARLENQRVSLNPVDTDAPTLLGQVSRTLHDCCDKEQVRAEAVNKVPEGKSLRLDVDLVKQITGVLVENAVRHARSSSDPAVLVQLASENGRLSLDVVDTGSGIDRADARTVFRPFKRGRGAEAAARRGIGLGLALARSWAGLLGGKLDLVERHDPTYGGARFRLTLPTRMGE